MKRFVYPTLLVVIPFGLLLNSCNKNTTPTPPVHDTVTVVKTDTLTVAPKPDPTVNLKEGLLVYLPFNGSIADSSGNNNATYAKGNVLTSDAHGYANSAFGGDGQSTKVIVINNGSIQFDTAYSLSYDFMIDVAPGSQRMAFVSMIDTATGENPSFLSGVTEPALPNLDEYASDITAGCGVYGPQESTNPAVMGDSSIIPLVNTWYNVIMVYKKGAIWIYVNGQLVSTKQRAGTAALLCSSSSLVVGAWWNGDLIPMSGKLDEVRLYNRTLTPHEIAALTQHYQVTSESVKPGPLRGK